MVYFAQDDGRAKGRRADGFEVEERRCQDPSAPNRKLRGFSGRDDKEFAS